MSEKKLPEKEFTHLMTIEELMEYIKERQAYVPKKTDSIWSKK